MDEDDWQGIQDLFPGLKRTQSVLDVSSSEDTDPLWLESHAVVCPKSKEERRAKLLEKYPDAEAPYLSKAVSESSDGVFELLISSSRTPREIAILGLFLRKGTVSKKRLRICGVRLCGVPGSTQAGL